MTEAHLQAQVIDLARFRGWRVAHFRPAMTTQGWRTAVSADGAGFPDLVLVREDRLMAVELKSERGWLTDEQAAWLLALQQAGVETHVWKPADWPAIMEALS